MRPGAIRVDRASRRFRVDPEPVRTLKELGLRLDRIVLPNADPAFVRTLAGLVRRAAAVPSMS